MPLPLFLIMMTFGVLYLVFAFVEPPSYIRLFSRVLETSCSCRIGSWSEWDASRWDC